VSAMEPLEEVFSEEDHEVVADGQAVVRGPDGKITKAFLTPERAAIMGRLGGRGKSDSGSLELGRALCDLLVREDDPKAAALTLLLGELANAAAKSSAGKVRAIETALELVGQRAILRPPEPWETCRLCGRTERREIKLSLSGAAAAALGEMLASRGAA